ncbi:MAG TPA: hypothetical protein VN758_06700 [Solirubrobacterales bacterium]|nr:hypothetical protein [Solirubrobacterales bacterium]
MAFAATSAQALGNWRIEGANINATKEFESEKDSNGFKILVPTMNIEVFCENFATDDGLLFAGVKAGEGLAELLFTTCSVNQLSPLTALPCTVANFTAKVKFSLILHKTKNYLYVEPDGGKEFTKIKFAGASCLLMPEYAITGQVVLQDGLSGDFATELIKHLVEEAPQKLFNLQFEEGIFLPLSQITFGSAAATLDGSAWLKLKAPEANKNWSGLV